MSVRSRGRAGRAEQPELTDEREALRVVKAGRWLPRARLALRSLRALLSNPADTRRTLVLSLIMNDAERRLRTFVRAPGGAELMRERPAIDSRSVDFAALARLPEGTLGRELATFVARFHLDVDFFQPPPELPSDQAYVIQRLRQTHDIWHILTRYGIDGPGEIALQAFSCAQTGSLAAGAIASMFAVRWVVQDPQISRAAVRGFVAGLRARPLMGVRWEDLWDTPVSEVRARFGIR